MFELFLLGKFELRVDGDRTEISSRPSRSLLAYLALQSDTKVLRDRLAGILWPKSSESSARSNLRQALWQLRQAVSDRWIEADKDSICLPVDDAVWIDVDRLLQPPTGSGDPDAWIEWAGLYQGELLPGWYEEWVLREREHLQATYRRHMPGALRVLLETERWEDALQWAEHWIALGHVTEPAYRALMRAHAGLGNSAAVADTFQRCRDSLRAELGVDPSRETRELYDELMEEEQAPLDSPDIRSAGRQADESPDSQEIAQDVKFCEAPDGARIAYASMGDGPPLVKAANYMTHLEYDRRTPLWDLYAELAQNNKLIRYDERGTGLSDWDVEDLSFEAWVSDMETVVAAQGLDRFSVLGISQGGTVSVTYAARHPDQVERLILIGAYARGWLNRDLSEEEREEERAFMTILKKYWGTGNPAFQRVFSMQLFPEADPEDLQWLDDLQSLTTTPENAAALERQMHRTNVSELAPKLQVPTLVLHSRHDEAVPFEEGRRLAALIPNARFVTLQSKNHIPIESEPAWDRMLEEVKRFLSDSE